MQKLGNLIVRKFKASVTSADATCPPCALLQVCRWKVPFRSAENRPVWCHGIAKKGGSMSRIEEHPREIRDETEGTGNVPVKHCKKIDRSRWRFGREGGSTSPRDLSWRRGHASMAAFLLFFRSFFSTPFPSLPLALAFSGFLALLLVRPSILS